MKTNNNLNLQIVKESYEQKLHIESKKFSFVHNRKVYSGNLDECADEIAMYILQNFNQVQYEFDLTKESIVYKYTITNGGEYEMLSVTTIYSNKYYTQTEFDKIVKEHIKNAKYRNDEFSIASSIVKNNKNFCFLEFGCGVNAYTFRIAYEISNGEKKEKAYKYLDEEQIEEVEEILKKYY